MTTIDKQVKTSDDKATIGLVICKTKEHTVVEYALHTSTQPMGVADYVFTQLPSEFAEYLPNADEVSTVFK